MPQLRPLALPTIPGHPAIYLQVLFSALMPQLRPLALPTRPGHPAIHLQVLYSTLMPQLRPLALPTRPGHPAFYLQVLYSALMPQHLKVKHKKKFKSYFSNKLVPVHVSLLSLVLTYAEIASIVANET